MTGMILPYQGRVPRIADDAFVAPNATVIGDVEIGSQSSIWFGCVVRGDVNMIRIGERSNIQDGTVVHVASGTGGGRGHPAVIGDDVLIGHMATIHACLLQDRCVIGIQACILDGAVVEPDAMVAAGALVTPGKVIRTGELWAGTPAKYVRDVTEEEAEMWRALTEGYVELAETYRSDGIGKPGPVAVS